MKLLIIDNYDSFTFNLRCILKELNNGPVDVFRNDRIGITAVNGYDKIVISPGPGIPSGAGITSELISFYAPVKSILGVCLGCQAIAEVFGGRLINLDHVYHGVATSINVLDEKNRIFNDLPQSFMGGRYHSWAIEGSSLPEDIKVTAEDENGMIMAISHKSFDVSGVQFHPESVLTQYGKQILQNWLIE